MTTEQITNRLERRIKALSKIRGVQNNQLTRSLIWTQEMNRYTTGIVEHDVLEGMPDPMFNEFKRQINRLSKAEFYSEQEQLEKTIKQFEIADMGPDRENPRFTFQSIDHRILQKMLTGEYDTETMIRRELNGRDLNQEDEK